jgi:hypothetical protein
MADGVLIRGRAAADRIALLHEELQAEQERRDAAIVEARDDGLRWTDIAEAMRLSQGMCARILAERS